MYTLLIFNSSPISVRTLLRLLTRRGPHRPGERSQVGSLARPRPPQPLKRVLDKEVRVVPRGKGWKRGCFPQRGKLEGPGPPLLALSRWCPSPHPSPNGSPPPSP